MSVPLARRYGCSSGGGGGGSIIVDVSCSPVINVDVSYNIDLGTTNEYLATLTNMDAFSRLRVSNPYTLFEFNSIIPNFPPDTFDNSNYRIISLPTGSGQITHDMQSYVQMSVNGIGSVIRQSREYIPYQPGKSKLVYLTGVLYTNPVNTTGITSRIGCFDSTMGIYIQMSNGVISVVENKAGALTNIPRSSWTDKLDGSGSSGVTVDFTKAQIFMFDFEWLGVGQVRCAIIQGGKIHYYYTFTHTGIYLLTAPYIQMAKLPVRYEIISTGGANSMRMICGTVISEGGISPIGKIFTHGNYRTGGVAVNGNIPAKSVPILGIRLRPGAPYSRATLKIKQVNVANTNTSVVSGWVLSVNPTYNATPSWQDFSIGDGIPYAYKACSVAQIATFPSPDTNPLASIGHIIRSGFITARDQSSVSFTADELIAAFPIGSNILGTIPDEVVLSVNTLSPAGGNSNIYAFIEWIEIM